jgi:Xaa-Pro aminopeptidase
MEKKVSIPKEGVNEEAPPFVSAVAYYSAVVPAAKSSRRVRAISFLCLLFVLQLGAQSIPAGEYKARRTELRKTLQGVMILSGANDPVDLHDSFYQETNFEYLTGWHEPGAVLLLTPQEEILFLPKRVASRETFNGRTTAPDDKDAARKAGVDKVLPKAALETQFLRVMDSSDIVYTLTGDAQAQALTRLSVLHEKSDAAAPITRFRLKKSANEIALIRKATDATVAAHRAAWKRTKPGMGEYQIAATMVETYQEMGCERSAYAPIVGSGPNSVILHYAANRRKLDAGDIVVMDVAGECSGYATDVTRTVPANGKFTARQREIYDIVLAAQKAAIAAIKPGVTIRGDLRKIAFDYMNTHGKDLHGEPLGKYFVHGLGHYVGLDVHDPGSPDIPLEAGMVITIEPGLYIPEENLGVRIEDTILVTATGAEVLSAALPKEVDDIERLTGK